jgi:hypothetical protein
MGDWSEVLTSSRLDHPAAEWKVLPYRLGIAGMEITQAIQYHDSDRHLQDPADRGDDNAIRMVAGKPAWVRVYPWSLFGATGLTGTLEIYRRVAGFYYHQVGSLAPDPSSAQEVHSTTLIDDYDQTRGDIGETVNFIIPAEEMIGHLRLVAHLTAGRLSATATLRVAVTLRQTLRLAGVMISYDGPASSAPNAPNLQLAAPTVADLQAMAGTALTLFPVASSAWYRSAGTLVQTQHLQDTMFPTSGCGTEWNALNARVANARTADGNRPGWIYYGLLPSGVPMGPVGGCGGGGIATGPIGQPWTLAHEAGHACGLLHAPSGNAPNPDVNFPVYEPHPQASIGEYGLDVNNGNVASPETFYDLMGYAWPKWISLYHYKKLLDNALLNPVTVGMDQPWWKDLVWEEVRKWPPIPDPDPPPFDRELELPMFPPSQLHDVISLIVRVERGEVAEVLHVARTRAHTELRDAVATAFTVRLRDAEGLVLTEGGLQRLPTAACGCGGCGCGGAGGGDGREPRSYLAQALLPDAGPGAVLEIAREHERDGRSEDAVVWRREAPGRPPRVGRPEVKVDRRGAVTVAWDVEGDVEELWLRWSRDGEQWRSVATGLTESPARIAAGELPPGEGLLQVVAHDGFFSTASKATAVKVPDRAPEAVILHPVERHTYLAGRSIRFWGSLAVPDAEVAESASWLVDGKRVARGLDAFVTLEPGEHKVALRLGDRGRATTVAITVVAAETGEER